MNFYILIFLTAFFASMTVLTTMQIVKGQSLSDLDLECRQNYHSYCFGEKWSKLVQDYCDDSEYNDPYDPYCDDSNYYDPIVQETKQQDKTDIYEDQSFLCKHQNHVSASTDHNIVCIVINDDDVMHKEGLDKTMQQFQNDLDTFDVSELSNMGGMK